MNRKSLAKIGVLLFFFSIYFSFLIQDVNAGWWNATWKKYQNFTVNETNGTTFTGMQVFINLTYDSDMKNDFSDVRFVDDNNSLMPCWNETQVNSQYIETWCKVPSLTASSNSTFSIYYNASNINGNLSDILGTAYNVGDEFTSTNLNSTMWNNNYTAQTGTVSIINNNYLKLDVIDTGDEAQIGSTEQFSYDSVLKWRANVTNFMSSTNEFTMGFQNQTSRLGGSRNIALIHDPTGYNNVRIATTNDSGSQDIGSSISVTPDLSNLTVYEMYLGNKSVVEYMRNKSSIVAMTITGFNMVKNLNVTFFLGVPGGTGSTRSLWLDWVFVRKYALQQPYVEFSGVEAIEPITFIFRNSTNEIVNNMTINYTERVNTTAYASSGTVSIFRNGTDISSQNNTNVFYGVGVYEIKINSTDNATGLTNYLTVRQISPVANMTLTIDNSSDATQTRTYLNTSVTSTSETNLLDFNVQYLLTRNGTNKGTSETVLLGAGVHNYTLNTSGNANYTSGTKEILLTVNRNITAGIKIFINGTQDGDKNITNNTIINVTGFLNTTQTHPDINYSGNYSINLINSGNPPRFENLTNYFNGTDRIINITVFTLDNANWTLSNRTQYIRLDVTPPNFYSRTCSNECSVVYSGASQTHQFNITINDTTTYVSNVIIEMDGINATIRTNQSSVFYVSYVGLSAITHTYRYYINDSLNNANVTDNYTYLVLEQEGGGGGGGGGGSQLYQYIVGDSYCQEALGENENNSIDCKKEEIKEDIGIVLPTRGVALLEIVFIGGSILLIALIENKKRKGKFNRYKI